MSKARLRAATVGGTPDDVETAFYEALQNADITQLMACWADEDDIVCVHPGGPRLVGSAAIRAAFEAVFANGGIPVLAQRVRKVESLASAMHNVLERVIVMTEEGPQPACVIATNVYHRTARAGAWWPITPAPARCRTPRRSPADHRCCIDAAASPVARTSGTDAVSSAFFDQNRPHPSVGWSNSAMKYRAPWWLPGGNLQTIWPALYARRVTGAPPPVPA
jgi:ketosteroid isomerase-like protein